MRRALLAGLVSGVAAAVLASVAAYALQWVFGTSYAELSVVPITVVSVLTNVVGGVVYYGLSRWTRRPAAIFAVLALVLATVDSVFVALNPLYPGFALVANPLHYIVAIAAAVLIPYVSGRGRNAQ